MADAVALFRELAWSDSSSIAGRQPSLDAVGTLALRASSQSSVLSAAVLDAFDGVSGGNNGASDLATAHFHRELLRQWKGSSRHIARLGSAAAILRFLVRKPCTPSPSNRSVFYLSRPPAGLQAKRY